MRYPPHSFFHFLKFFYLVCTDVDILFIYIQFQDNYIFLSIFFFHFFTFVQVKEESFINVFLNNCLSLCFKGATLNPEPIVEFFKCHYVY